MPEPCDGVHVAPSSSVYSIRLAGPASCETKVRPTELSVKRIGSSVLIEVSGALTSSHVAVEGVTESLKRTRKVCRADMNMAAPVFQLTPTVGSPALSPRPAGAAKF